MTHDRAFDMTGQLRTGRHFVQIPGPSNVPDVVLRAVSAPTIDHRGPEFAVLLSFNAVSAKALEASRAAGLPNVPEEHDADEVRRTVLDRFDMSLGAGLGKLTGLPVETDGVAAALAVLEKE